MPQISLCNSPFSAQLSVLMTRSPTFAAVIPLYNKADTIARGIASVFAQERLPEFLVVVDDGSSDGSGIAARKALASAPSGINCLLIQRNNAGVSVARNIGANHFSSDYIAFLDADDEWSPGHISELKRLARAVPEAGILSCRHRRFGPEGTSGPEPSALPMGFFGEVKNGLAAYRRGYGILHTSSIAVSRNAWKRSGGFPPEGRKSQDMHLWLRLLLTERFAHSDECTGIWHEEATGVVRRSGAVPVHFSYFLDSEEGRAALQNKELASFLSVNLASHVAGHRLRGDFAPVKEMLRLSASLPTAARWRCCLLAKIPLSVLRAVAGLRRIGKRRGWGISTPRYCGRYRSAPP